MQASGKIYPTFNKTIHRIRYHQYFPQGVPYQWKHARTMDYHPHVPCAVLWTSISLQNEIFVWGEYAPALAKINTFEATKMMAELSLDYKYMVNLIDPLACVMQPRTNTSVRDDINEFFATFKKNGVGTGAYFEPFDTRPTRGREEMRIRLANATKVKVPFNNKCVVEDDSGIPRGANTPVVGSRRGPLVYLYACAGECRVCIS